MESDFVPPPHWMPQAGPSSIRRASLGGKSPKMLNLRWQRAGEERLAHERHDCCFEKAA